MDLELANKRLQARILELESEIVKLKDRLSESQLHLSRAHAKVAEMKEVKRAKEVKQDTSAKITVVHNRHANPNNNIESKASKYIKRQKMIYGILKNPIKYNLSEIEKSFLLSIEKTPTLTQKQFDWYTSIKKRVK